MTTDKKIALAIYRAQIASDAGKYTSELAERSPDKWTQHFRLEGRSAYAEKDRQIRLAIGLICRTESKNFRFCVTEGDISPFLVYFDFKINGKREQVSFHSFDYSLKKWKENSKRSTWDRKSSRKAAEMLLKNGVSAR